MGAWETDGYNMSVNSYWVNKDKSSGGGGGSDIPDFPNQRGFFLKTAQGDDGIQLEWENFKDNVKEIVHPIFQNDSFYVGKVLTRTGTGINDYGWEDVPGGNSETVLFDGDVEVESGHTGYFVREIPLADRIELCQGVHAKYSTLIFEASYVRSRPEDEKTETVNISHTFDLERLLIGDAQTYNDPQYDTDDTAHVILRNDELVERMGGEKYLLSTIQINQKGTDPANNVYTGKFFRVTFQYYTFNNGSSEVINLPKEQKVRVKITVK